MPKHDLPRYAGLRNGDLVKKHRSPPVGLRVIVATAFAVALAAAAYGLM